MPEAVDLGHAISLPPRRAIKYFREKGYTISWDWFDTLQEAHTKAFTVAKATRLDVLKSIRQGVDSGIARGITEQQFVKELEPNLRKLGWWGKQVVVDPRGGAEVVQLGSPHRLKTIYRTNINTAYATARYRQHLENVDSRPYWQYISIQDSRVRPDHAALHGKVFRYDDPFWDTHYPPNGWNCRCRVRALTAEQVKERGITVSTSEGKLSTVNQELGFSKRTGEIFTVQGTKFTDKGVTLLPDGGWSYNPGRDFPLYDVKGDVPDTIAKLHKKQPSFKDFALPALSKTPPNLKLPLPQELPKSNDVDGALTQLTTALSLGQKGWRTVNTPDALDDITIASSYLPHVVQDRKAARERYANYILPALQNPLEVWLTQYEDGSYRKRFISVFENGGRPVFIIARENRDGSFFYNFVTSRLRSIDNLRKGFLLYRREDG